MAQQNSNNFDFLRYFAAFAVLFSHSYPLTGSTQEPFSRYFGYETGGGLGVAIFFVMSGYLISGSLSKNNNLFRFLKNRFLRIYPAYFICIIVTWLASSVYLNNFSITQESQILFFN